MSGLSGVKNNLDVRWLTIIQEERKKKCVIPISHSGTEYEGREQNRIFPYRSMINSISFHHLSPGKILILFSSFVFCTPV